MSGPRRYEWAFNKPPKGQPTATFVNGIIVIYVGSGYRSMSVADAEAVIADLTAAVAKAKEAANARG